MVKKDMLILQHIKDYGDEIKSFIERFGNDYETFCNDRAFFNAVTMSILQIGELSGSLSDTFRKNTSGKIPWQNIRGLRNIVAHDYGSLDEKLVWETATSDIPKLSEFCVVELNRAREAKSRDEAR